MHDLLKRIGFDPSRGVPTELDEQLYAIAAAELATSDTRPGLMAKAFADAEGDDRKPEAYYLRLRVAQLRGEYEAAVAELARQSVPTQLKQTEYTVQNDQYNDAYSIKVSLVIIILVVVFLLIM